MQFKSVLTDVLFSPLGNNQVSPGLCHRGVWKTMSWRKIPSFLTRGCTRSVFRKQVVLTSIKVHFTFSLGLSFQLWTILKYHEWYLCQISCKNHAVFVFTTTRKGFVNFTADPLSLHTLVTSHWPFNNAPCTYPVVIVTVGAPWT